MSGTSEVPSVHSLVSCDEPGPCPHLGISTPKTRSTTVGKMSRCEVIMLVLMPASVTPGTRMSSGARVLRSKLVCLAHSPGVGFGLGLGLGL